jgi:hypothetical protein
MIEEEHVFFTINGKEYCDNELALSVLLKKSVLFCNERYYSESKDCKSIGPTIVIFVNCNDIFAWACADAECLPLDEIPVLYRMWERDKAWGPAKWCCIRRNEKPQEPVIDYMKSAGVWDDIMEKLPDNNYDLLCKGTYESKLKEKEKL